MEAFLQWFGLFAKIARFPTAAMALASGFALFAPGSALSSLGLVQGIDDSRKWIGTVFLISTAALLADGIRATWKFGCEWWVDRRRANAMEWSLENLTEDEKAHLRPFILENRASVSYAPADGVAGGLCVKSILFRPVTMGTIYHLAHNIQPGAREYLLKHPELLEASAPAAVETPNKRR